MGLNPYTEICQLYHEIRPQEGVTLPDGCYPLTLGTLGTGDITLYGWPYRHGFPYFPMMFLGYVPFVMLVDGLDAIQMRIRFLVACALGIHHLGRGWHRSRIQSLLPYWRCWGVPFLSDELFVAGVTDLWIGMLALVGVPMFAARARIGGRFLPGVVAGGQTLARTSALATHCALCWRAERSQLRSVLLGLMLGIGGSFVPYVMQDSAYFLSVRLSFIW